MMNDVDQAAQRVAEHIRHTPELWRLAETCITQTYSRPAAARQFVDIMRNNLGQSKTPGGDRYTQGSVKLAMQASSAVPASALLVQAATLPTSEKV